MFDMMGKLGLGYGWIIIRIMGLMTDGIQNS